MLERTYRVNGKNIKDLNDLIGVFAGFAYTDIENNIIDDSEVINNRYSDNFNHLNDFLFEITHKIDKNNFVLINIFNSSSLKEILDFRYREKYLLENLERIQKKYKDDFNRISYLKLELQATKDCIVGTSMFDNVVKIIHEKPNIALILS